MSDLITIFVNGGEYVDKAAYIQQRDEASRLREEVLNQKAEIERLTAEIERLTAEHGEMNEANVRYEKRIELLEAATLPFFTWMYNQGYQSGHHDTVEGMFTDVLPDGSSEYHDDIVADLLGEYAAAEEPSELLHTEPPWMDVPIIKWRVKWQEARIAELEDEIERLTADWRTQIYEFHNECIADQHDKIRALYAAAFYDALIEKLEGAVSGLRQNRDMANDRIEELEGRIAKALVLCNAGMDVSDIGAVLEDKQ